METKTKGVISFVLAIVGLLLILLEPNLGGLQLIIPLILSFPGIYLGLKERKERASLTGTFGLVINIINLILSVAYLFG